MERIYYGIYPGLDLDVIYIRLFDLKNAITDHKMGKIEDISFCFQLVSVARPQTSP